jgi:transposase
MFIKEITKKNKSSDKVFTYHRLIEAYRTQKGPRHRVVLNLGRLTIDRSEWKLLANRIEDMVYSRGNIFPSPEHIEKLAKHYASLITSNKLNASTYKEPIPVQEYRSVDINTLSTSKVRTIGAEHIAHSFWERIRIPEILYKCGFTKEQANIAELLVLSRLISPGSELHTLDWAENTTGLCELLNTNFKGLPLVSLYRGIDRIYEKKDIIEQELRDRQKYMFNLKEKIILYDLTNTYFEGSKYTSKKLAFGRSKEKRNDARLITLGMLVDENGFAKASHFFEGNVSEPKTLETAIGKLSPDNKPIIILDAGIASEENLTMLREKGFDYICVTRKKPVGKHSLDAMVSIRSDGENSVEACRIEEMGETFLFCKSLKMGKKESSMLLKFREKFENGLCEIQASILKKKGTKSYDKVLERIGRLKERSHGIHRAYLINIEKDDKGIVTSIRYEFQEKEYISRKYEGCYYLRSSRNDLSEKELWELYITLTGIEDTFRTLKDELKMRPVFHHKEERIEGHLFIAVLAYHILNAIRYQLHSQGYSMKWSTVREIMATQVVSTIKMKEQSGSVVYIRHTSEAEYRHQTLYDALSLNSNPIPPRKSIL